MEQGPLRSTDVRDRNRKLILRTLFQEGPLSQSQIVLRTGLKAPTVFRIFSKLEEESFIRPCKGPHDETASVDRKGRRPSYYCVVPHSAFAMGVDFSTAGGSVLMVNFVNDVIHHATEDFPEGIRREELLSRLGRMIGSAIDTSEVDPKRILGIGIGAPGIVDTASGIVVDYRRIEGLTGYSLKDHFQNTLGLPVLVHNNTSMIAASEYHYDSAREYDSVLAVLVRGGVGAAFVNHGKIFLNGTTTALELGRTSIAVCSADEVSSDSGTLETVVGEVPLLDYLREKTDVQSWDDVETSLKAEGLGRLISEQANHFATSVRNLYHVVHPDAILVISRYTSLAGVLTSAVDQAVPEIPAIAVTYDPVKACLGATDLVFQRFFDDLEWPLRSV